MLLWMLIALMTGAAVLAVLLPLGRTVADPEPDEQARRVYLHQLSELQRDAAEGRIAAGEAEAARAEIARRLIALDKGRPAPTHGPASPVPRRAVAVAAIGVVPLLSLSLYLGLGAPALPGQPLAVRLQDAPGAEDIQTLIAKVEEQLARSPEDGRGWDAIAPIYLRLGRAAQAELAFRNAIRLLGSNAARQAGLGEAIMAGQSGVVTASARAAFEAANAADPAAPAPRFYLGLAKEQEGEKEEAAASWRALLAEAPADALWRAPVEQALARVAGGPAPGPTADQVAAAEGMAPGERSAMIGGMVDGLAERLRGAPDDVEGWLRLIRSYAVLNRRDDAAAAAQAALKGVSGDGDRARVAALVADLGLRIVETGAP